MAVDRYSLIRNLRTVAVLYLVMVFFSIGLTSMCFDILGRCSNEIPSGLSLPTTVYVLFLLIFYTSPLVLAFTLFLLVYGFKEKTDGFTALLNLLIPLTIILIIISALLIAYLDSQRYINFSLSEYLRGVLSVAFFWPLGILFLVIEIRNRIHIHSTLAKSFKD
jgi:hypothetical protein